MNEKFQFRNLTKKELKIISKEIDYLMENIDFMVNQAVDRFAYSSRQEEWTCAEYSYLNGLIWKLLLETMKENDND